MYKYLYKKLEQSHGVRINQMTLIAFEMLTENHSETMNDFKDNDPEIIAEILGWKKTKETYKRIKDEIADQSFVGLLYRTDQLGFIAECLFPEHSLFTFNENGEFSSCQVNEGICRCFWVYADSIGELTDKILEKSDELYEEQMNNKKNHRKITK